MTLQEAASILVPEMTEKQLRTIVRALRWQPAGRRQVNRRGHGHDTYPAEQILKLHAALTPWLGEDVRLPVETSCPEPGYGQRSLG